MVDTGDCGARRPWWGAPRRLTGAVSASPRELRRGGPARRPPLRLSSAGFREGRERQCSARLRGKGFQHGDVAVGSDHRPASAPALRRRWVRPPRHAGL